MGLLDMLLPKRHAKKHGEFNITTIKNIHDLYSLDKNSGKNLVRKAYWTNGDVYSICSRIARNAAHIPRLLFEKGRNGELIPVDENSLTGADLYRLITKRPNENTTAIAFRQESITNLLTRGNSFVYGRHIIGQGGEDVFNELHLLLNNTVSIKCGVKDFRPQPIKYTVQVGGTRTPFDPSQIIQTKYYNPSDQGIASCLGLSHPNFFLVGCLDSGIGCCDSIF